MESSIAWRTALLVGFCLAITTLGAFANIPRGVADPMSGRGQNGVSSAPHSDVETPEAYMHLLESLKEVSLADDSQRNHIRRHLSALEPLLPTEMVETFGIREFIRTGEIQRLSNHAGSQLAAWWRRQDPFPATSPNERLIEHLSRADHAFSKFAREDDSDVIDDRGRIYIRFGKPAEKIVLRARSRAASFARYEGEFWVYTSLHANAEYLFVRERGRGFYLGDPTDLLPENARSGFGPTSRGERRAARSLSVLVDIYSELAHYRSRYGTTYSDLAMYAEQVRQLRSGFQAELNLPLHSYVPKMIRRIQTNEHYAAKQRRETVPRIDSDVGDDIGSIPIATRFVRTLDADGRTKVNLYWSITSGDLHAPKPVMERLSQSGISQPDAYVLACSVIEQSAEFKSLNEHTDQAYLRPIERRTTDTILPARKISFPLHRQTQSAAVQLDVHWARVDSMAQLVRPTALVARGAIRLDTLSSLKRHPSSLEMSDLKPLLVQEDEPIDRADVYAHHTLEADHPIALAFDIYHLLFDENDRTSYSVEYDVLRETDNDGFRRLRRGNDRIRTSVETKMNGAQQTAKELIRIDLREWRVGQEQNLRIVVRVHDHVSGQVVERSIDFFIPD